MIKYYIYHIKGVKIGVSEEPEVRVKKQGYNDYEILEEFTCIYLVSYREIALQKEYGYPVDKILYYKTVKMSSKGGQKAVETGQLAEARKKAFKTNFQIVSCPHCGKEGKKLNMSVWHFDKCKHKPTST